MTKISIVILILSLNSCILTYFTEDDKLSLIEKNKYSKISGSSASCSDCSAFNRPRYRFSKDNHPLIDLRSSNSARRTRAVTEIAESNLNDSQTISKIKNLALSDPSKWVRRASIKALVKLTGDDSIWIYKKLTKDKDRWVRSSAQNALKSCRK